MRRRNQTKGSRSPQEWCEVISDLLWEEGIDVTKKELRADSCVLDVKEKRPPQRKAVLHIYGNGSINVVDIKDGASLVQETLERRGVGKLMASEMSEELSPYIGRKVYPRTGSETMKPGIIRSMRACTLESCGGDCLLVEWPDGQRTWPCLNGMTERPDGDFQIS